MLCKLFKQSRDLNLLKKEAMSYIVALNIFRKALQMCGLGTWVARRNMIHNLCSPLSDAAKNPQGKQNELQSCDVAGNEDWEMF